MKEKFKYVVIAVVLLIPFIYSFFYLKAYWNPYGKGNIDNIPVAVVNSDEGDKGEKLVQSIKDSEKLKLSVVSSEEAEEGLSDGKYYAMINIPKSFTSDMESASETKKHHATITYSPNQKANFLASQIINSVVNAVEKSLDNEVNSAIVENLSENIEEVPNKLDTISSGFSKLKDGTSKLNEGSTTLSSGTNTLSYNYNKFNTGVSDINSGASKLKDGADKLSSGIQSAKSGSEYIKSSVDNKINELENDTSSPISNEELAETENSAKGTISGMENDIKSLALMSLNDSDDYQALTYGINQLKQGYIDRGLDSKEACKVLGDTDGIIACVEGVTKYYLLVSEKETIEKVAQDAAYQAVYTASGDIAKKTAYSVAAAAKQKATQTSIDSLRELSNGLGSLNNGLTELYSGSLELSSGVHTLFNGTNTLYNSSLQLKSGINTLNNGAQTLNSGINTLDASVLSAKTELDSNIDNTKQSVKKVETLSEYSKQPIKVDTKEVNKVNSYGTAFSPLFMSIGLWIGCLMMFMVFYYDKEERFGILGMNSKNKTKQIMSYHGLITIAALSLGLLLQLFLDLEITNIPLYYISLVLIGNMFMGIIEFLIISFNDIGKFIALILLVLQLAAAGGTFPVETISKGFRWMHNYLPMSYSVDLMKESLIAIQNNLLTKSMVVIIALAIAFFVINILVARLKQQKNIENN